MKDVVLKEIMKELIISKDDFKVYFQGRKIINKSEYITYLKKYEKINLMQFLMQRQRKNIKNEVKL